MSKVTIITGGSRGIGAAAAKLLAENGHAVAVNYVVHSNAADRVVAAITEAGGRAMAVQADTSLEADVVRMFETVETELGPVTGLVNNAGIHGPRGRVDELADADIARVFDVNVRGCFLCAREAVKRMSTKHGGSGGAIVNVSSGSATAGAPGGGVLYAASKGAVNSLTIGLSQEVGGEGIRVNTVSPGMTKTDMPGEDRLAAQPAVIPMGRVGEPQEIAEAILWLLSDEASYVAGANLRVGGGKPWRSMDFLFDGPADAPLTIALAHGAGAPMDSLFMQVFAESLGAAGFRVARFEFPYMAERRSGGKKRPPNPAPVLLETWRTVVGELGADNLVIGGKSMGGRMASLIADESAVRGLVCLGYPFHAPGKPPGPNRLEHLETLKTPTLICQGTRDALGTQEDVAGYTLSGAIRVHWLEDGDHGFKPRKASGLTEEDNWDSAIQAITDFAKGR